MYGYDAGNTRYRPDVQGIREKPSVKWRDPINPDSDTSSDTLSGEYKPPEAPGSSPAVVNGTVYVGTLENGFVAYEAETGEELWRYKDGREVGGSPAVIDGTAYIGMDDALHAVDTETGEHMWDLDMGESPAITFHEGVVYAAGEGDIHAIDVEAREKLWSSDADYYRTYRHPAVAGGNVYYSSGTVYSFDAETGEENWSIQLDDTSAYVAVSDGVLYTVAEPGMWAIDAESGEKLWEFEIDRYPEAPAVDGEKVYVGGRDSPFCALDAGTGEVAWSTDEDFDLEVPPTVAGGVVYACHYTTTGTVTAFDTETGEELWESEEFLPKSGVVVDDESIYLGGHWNNLLVAES